MTKYINADELMQKVNENHYLLASFDNSKDFGMFDCGIKQVVDEMPSADVIEVIHGEWIGNSFDFYCSNCKQYQNFYAGKSNFCPNCGADMRERKETE